MTIQNWLMQKELKMVEVMTLSQQKDMPVIALRLNIPGPEKKTNWSSKLFMTAINDFELVLNENEIAYQKYPKEDYYEHLILYVVYENAILLKELCISLENLHPLGRIFDIDVYNRSTTPLSRQDFKTPSRKCYLCDELSTVCSRNGTHSLEALQTFLISKANAL